MTMPSPPAEARGDLDRGAGASASPATLRRVRATMPNEMRPTSGVDGARRTRQVAPPLRSAISLMIW